MSENKAQDFHEFNKQLEESVIKQINAVLDNSSEQIKNQIDSENKLLSPELRFQRKKQEIIEFVKSFGKELGRLEYAMETFNTYKYNYLTEREVDKFDKEIEGFAERLLEFDANKPLGNLSFQEFFGISNFIPYCLYTVAYNLHEKELYAAAGNLFFYLTLINPYVKDHWKGLGIAEKKNRRYEAALSAFAMNTLLDLEDPSPHLFSAECYIALKDIENAKHELELAQKLLEDRPKTEWHLVMNSLQAVIETLDKGDPV